MVRTTLADTSCPACGARGLEYTAEAVDLPFLGRSLETLLRCEQCGYRHADFMLTEHKAPTRYTMPVRRAEDMTVRVVRSSSGTIRIPELGIAIEPGVASEAFVSNIEGILVRIERVLDQLGRDAEDDAELAKVMALQERLGDLRVGKGGPVTVVIEDPFGNSAILGDDARHESIPPEEAASLRLGAHIVDLDPGGATSS